MHGRLRWIAPIVVKMNVGIWPTLSGAIQLPGSLQAQGYGDEVGLETPWVGTIVDHSLYTDDRYAPYRQPENFKTPFWLQPEKYYSGVAWVQRVITIPAEWRGQRITLTLERPHWETTVWLDDKRIGRNDSLATAHVYDLGTQVAPGEHRLTIRVDNRVIVDVGPNAHSITDHTQSNWNGIVGRIELTAGSPAWLRNVRVFPDVTRKSALVKIDVASVWGKSARGKVTVSAQRCNVPGEQVLPAVSVDFGFSVAGGLSGLDLSAAGGHVDIDYALGDDAQTWDEFHPALYALTVDLELAAGDEVVHDRRVVTFGLREVGTQGTQITLNGQADFPARHAGMLHLPAHGLPAHRCRELASASFKSARRTGSITFASIPGARPRPPLSPPTSLASTIRWSARPGPTRAPPSARGAPWTSGSFRKAGACWQITGIIRPLSCWPTATSRPDVMKNSWPRG